MEAKSKLVVNGAQYSRRAFLCVAGLATGSLVLAACQPAAPAAQSGGGQAAAPAAEQVTLRFQNWFNESDMKSWQIGLDKFKKEKADVDLKLEFADWGDTVSTVMAGAAAGSLPDVIMASDEHVPPTASVGLILDLNPFIEKDPDVKTDDFAPGVSRGFHIWDHWWGFPYDQSTFGIYYNKKMFEDAGVELPPGEGGKQWTLEQFVEAAKKLTQPDGKQWGILTNQGQYLDSAFIFSEGGRNFDDDGRKCLINSPETVEALQFMVDLVHKHKVAPPPAELAGGSIDYFASGLAAMEFNGQWELQNKNAKVDFDFDIGYLPIGKTQKTVTGGSGFCLSAKTKYPDEAWAFLKSYTSTETLSEMVGRPGRGIPARWSATPAYLEAGGKAKHPSAFIEQLKWAFNDRATLASPQYADSFTRHFGKIYETGEGDIAAALVTIAEETDKALEEKWKGVTIKI